METIDLRSDTVTQPTPEMREAMAQAEVGDDVYGEDPTINRLQEMAAERLGKEAGLFVASGTMGNLIAILAHCQRGDEVIVGKKNHVFLHEAGGISALGGVHSSQIPNQPDGSLRLEDVAAAIRSDDPHEPVTRLVCLENTHNACGGVYQTPEYTRQIGGVCPRTRPVCPPGWGADFQRRCRPGSDCPRIDRAGRFGHILPEQRACARRSGRCCAGRNRLSSRRSAFANCWAAGCVRRVSWRLPESLHWKK